MSFDVFLQCFSKGERKTFPRSIVDEALGPYIEAGPSSLPTGRLDLDLEFDGRRSGTLFMDDADMIDGFSINRPGGKELYSILLDIMKRTSSALYWPGGAAVTDPAVIPDLPQGLVENLPLRVVHTVDELLEHIRNS